MSAAHAAFVQHYGMPMDDPWLPRPSVEFCRRGEGRLRTLAGRVVTRGHGRLAYVDTHFPWKRSGFRYDEALAMYELRPDTLFFSLWPLEDEFPAEVHPLSEFPRRATLAGVTDVYTVFLNAAAGLLGETTAEERSDPAPTVAPDLSSVLARSGMRLHAGLYPGGGLTLGPESLERARRVCARAATVFTWVPDLAPFDHVQMVPPAILNPSFYELVERDWSTTPIRVMFAADQAPRKGLDVFLAAAERLDDRFRFEVVGPHAEHAGQVSDPRRFRFSPWQDPDGLRAGLGATHVFVCPVRPEESSDGQMIDGFPTTTAGSAMCTGALLISGNPRRDHSVLRPGETHLELDPANVDNLVAALLRVADDREGAAAIARTGAARVRSVLDVRAQMRHRLEGLGLVAPAAD